MTEDILRQIKKDRREHAIRNRRPKLPDKLLDVYQKVSKADLADALFDLVYAESLDSEGIEEVIGTFMRRVEQAHRRGKLIRRKERNRGLNR